MGTFARLFDGDAAAERLQINLQTQMRKNLFPIMGEVTDMWYCAWELDGNTGITAAMCEVFVQSHDDTIHLLPALPSAWEKGYLNGIALIGGNQLSLKWENHNLIKAVLLANLSGEYQIRYKDKVVALDIEKGVSYRLDQLF
jgi:alpha-L-fucosidase 2